MKDWYKFYRNGLACALHYKEDGDIYFGYIGFPKEHIIYGSTFQNINSTPLYHSNMKFENTAHDKLWWMYFDLQTTYHKALDKLKNTVDAVQKKEPAKTAGFSML